MVGTRSASVLVFASLWIKCALPKESKLGLIWNLTKNKRDTEFDADYFCNSYSLSQWYERCHSLLLRTWVPAWPCGFPLCRLRRGASDGRKRSGSDQHRR